MHNPRYHILNGWLPWFQKEVWLYVSLWENAPTSLALLTHFPYKFIVSITCFSSSSTQHKVHLANYGTFWNKIDSEAGYASRTGYLAIDKSLPQHFLGFSVRSSQYGNSLHPLVQSWSLLAPKYHNAKLSPSKQWLTVQWETLWWFYTLQVCLKQSLSKNVTVFLKKRICVVFNKS